MGLQPIRQDSQAKENKELTDTEKPCLQTSLQRAESEQNSNFNPPADLEEIIEAWNDLPEHVKQTIRTLVTVTAKEKQK